MENETTTECPVNPVDVSPQGFESLTKREREVFYYLCDGYETREIAVKLNRSPRTIETHRGRVFKKLGVKGAVHLVLFAIKNGLIEVIQNEPAEVAP